MSRTRFVRNNRFECSDGSRNWSFIDHGQRRVLMGLWNDYLNADRSQGMIFSDGPEWTTTSNGRVNPNWGISRAHLRFVEDQGYALLVYRMECLNPVEASAGARREIAYFANETLPARLSSDGNHWFVEFEGDIPDWESAAVEPV